MAPILIDPRGLIKLGLISLLTLLVVFFAGYFSGYQKAVVFYTTANEIEALDLPEHGAKDSSDVNAQLPKMTVPGEEIDVDQPVDIKPDLARDNSSQTEGLVIAQAENTTTEIPTKVVGVSSDDITQLDMTEEAIAKLSPKKLIEVIPDDATQLKKEYIEISNLTADALDEIKYSAQVGVYGNLVNAENMVKLLQAKSFNAYVSDYTNKKNETRYNVRFGYFLDKKSAISALKKYKKSEKGDGYLVNFAVDSIVSLANKNVVKPVVPAVVKDKTESLDSITTETNFGEVTNNETTQDEILSESQSKELVLN
jgi:cell division septation protein DedD